MHFYENWVLAKRIFWSNPESKSGLQSRGGCCSLLLLHFGLRSLFGLDIMVFKGTQCYSVCGKFDIFLTVFWVEILMGRDISWRGWFQGQIGQKMQPPPGKLSKLAKSLVFSRDISSSSLSSYLHFLSSLIAKHDSCAGGVHVSVQFDLEHNYYSWVTGPKSTGGKGRGRS